MPNPLRILLVTDAFPPVCGGSGWSTFELARGLRDLGHTATIVRPRPGTPPGLRTVSDAYDGFDVLEFGVRASAPPFFRNYLKNERLTARFVPVLRRLVREGRIDVVHGQHLLSTPAAIAAARAERAVAVCTVRDYWPVCYWSDLIHDRNAIGLCPACSAGMMTRCVRPRAGVGWPLALPFIPYMRRNLAWKRATLADADAVVAVSSTLARDLQVRAPELRAAATRGRAAPLIEVIPNPVDLEAIRSASSAKPVGLPDRYAIFVGKLAPNKGVAHLIAAAARAHLQWPLVIVGDGPERRTLEQASARAGLDARFTGWLDRTDVWRHVAHASLLVFPSAGPESLSRVLLEAGALGVAIAAMDTGGTRDILTDEVTGLLSGSVEELANDIARLVADESLRERLAVALRAHVEQQFAAAAVVPRFVELYRRLSQHRGVRESDVA